MTARRLAALATATLLLAPALAACSDDSSDAASEVNPEEVLALASDKLLETSGVELTLATGALPPGVSGIARAAGTITDAPAFDGILTVVFAGQTADVPVIAVDDVVYAEIPFTDGWDTVNPKEYGARTRPRSSARRDSLACSARPPSSRRAPACAAARTTTRSSPPTAAPSPAGRWRG